MYRKQKAESRPLLHSAGILTVSLLHSLQPCILDSVHGHVLTAEIGEITTLPFPAASGLAEFVLFVMGYSRRELRRSTRDLDQATYELHVLQREADFVEQRARRARTGLWGAPSLAPAPHILHSSSVYSRLACRQRLWKMA